jgi:hypothetical protein
MGWARGLDLPRRIEYLNIWYNPSIQVLYAAEGGEGAVRINIYILPDIS